jgi:threonine efflux protein
MITLTLFTVWALHMAVMLSPGVNTLLVSQMAASGQTRSVRWAVLGICTATLVWASAAVMGLHTVFTAFPDMQRVLQLVGGLYLLHVAVRLWRSSAQTGKASAQAPVLSAPAAYRLGLMTNITNPKAVLFFASVFSTALPANPDLTIQIAAGAVAVLNALAWHFFLAYLFGQPRLQALYAKGGSWFSRCAAGIVGALGLQLVFSVIRDWRRSV